MKRKGIRILFVFYYINFILCQDDMQNLMATNENILEAPSFVFWPHGNIPFFINNDHFDNEQTLIIMTSLSLVAFKTCLKFAPVMVPPADHEHVLTFVNPHGTHKCDIHAHGHSMSEPHVVLLGYDCLQAPWMDRIVLRALGLPFEHNRQSRDSYIDVQYENIEQHAIPLFTKDITLPAALRALPYDINSVMHFGDRDYSKNGHRTIIFKDRDTKQKWNGPSDLDLRKIEIIYGEECKNRDRQEKIELCHMYPGVPLVDRKKRSVDLETTRSLRVNRDITPPSETNASQQVQDTLKNLDIEAEVQNIVEDVFKVSNKALMKTRATYCNATKETLRSVSEITDIHGIIELVADYAQEMVDHAVNNLTSFCVESDSIEKYQSLRCRGCQKPYRSTKISKPYHSTKHDPAIRQSTRHSGGIPKPPFYPQYSLRAQDDEKPQNETKVEAHVINKRDKIEPVLGKSDASSLDDTGVKRSKRGVTGAYREGKMRKRKSKMDVHRRGRYSEETEEDDSQSSEERDKKKMTTPVTREGKVGGSKKLRKPRKIGRQVKKIKRPSVVQESEEFDNRPRKVKKITKPSVVQESEESDNGPRQSKWNKKQPTTAAKEPEDSPESSTEEEQQEENGGEIKKPLAFKDEGKSAEAYLANLKKAKRSPKTVELSKENDEFYKQRMWPGGIVPYVISRDNADFDLVYLRRRLAMVNASLAVNTCVHIEEIEDNEQGNGTNNEQGNGTKYDDYLVLDTSPDFVTGRVGGRQIFGTPELLEGGQHRQHTAMMVMAMLGFYFELSRHDRDDYVKVHQRHIRADKLHHFEKIGADATLALPYDYESATHPPWMYWRKLGKKGIATVATFKDKDPDGKIMKSLGQHNQLLSELDIIKINSVYGIKCMIDETVNEPMPDWD